MLTYIKWVNNADLYAEFGPPRLAFLGVLLLLYKTHTRDTPTPPLAIHMRFHVKKYKIGVYQMAGKALRRRILEDVKKKGGAEYLAEQIGSGMTMTKLAAQYECSREYFSRSVRDVPEYNAAITEARRNSADALVEEGLTMVDALDGQSTTQEIAATREKVQWRKFMAGSYNQERYGNRPQTNVTISVSDMHLDALRKVNSDIAAIDAEDRQREATSIEADYEDVTDD